MERRLRQLVPEGETIPVQGAVNTLVSLFCSCPQVLEQVHPRLKLQEDALRYIEKLMLRLLTMLCARPQPHSV